jgi:hypothetical protein
VAINNVLYISKGGGKDFECFHQKEMTNVQEDRNV